MLENQDLQEDLEAERIKTKYSQQMFEDNDKLCKGLQKQVSKMDEEIKKLKA